MSEYLDKTGLAYFWGKVKEKLNNKADNDRYKVINVSSEKFKFKDAWDLTYYKDILYLNTLDFNKFVEPFPSGYHILCMLAVKICYFKNEEDYNADKETEVRGAYSILPIDDSNLDKYRNQPWNVVYGENMNMYGIKYYYTLLLEKD